MSNKTTNIIAILLLVFMAILAVFSIGDDSLTMDELSHLPAGYSYLTQKDMRINPEHPPLIKDLAAFPLLFIKDIKFPSEIKAWKEDINGQWDYGGYFLYKTGNPVDKMIFWGKIPMILILILLGFYIFRWSKELFGNKASLLALFLFSFSPTFLANGRLVTTDVGAAAGVVIATYYFIKFLQNYSRKNLIIAGIALGIAELTKFSVILLLPFFGILIFVWAIIKSVAPLPVIPSELRKSSTFKEFVKTFATYLFYFILIIIIGYILVWIYYIPHVWNYPTEKQIEDTKFILSSFGNRTLVDLTVWMAGTPIFKPIAQYVLGLLMVLQRTVGGNTGYFLGEISAAGWKNYFPIVYFIKETLTFHILTIISLLYLAWLVKKPFWQEPIKRVLNWLRNHFTEFAMVIFIAIYWVVSLRGNLNIGVRHLLPAFPFTILLVSGVISLWLKRPFLKLKYSILGILVLWQAISVVSVYPHFLSYFNELAGGPKNGYIYVVDSNLDWGQDLKRLTKWVDKNNINKIYVDYFGGGNPEYYLKEKYARWSGTNDPKELPKGSYLAVSVNFLQQGRAIPIPGFDQPTGYYLWLDQYKPMANIGNSIFVYHIK